MGKLTIELDGTRHSLDDGLTVLQAARQVGIYIPTLCSHPDLPPAPDLGGEESVYRGNDSLSGQGGATWEGCRLCLVEIDGLDEPVPSCSTQLADGMAIRTDTETVKRKRRANLARILATHPHACLTCAQREGCSRTQCSSNVPENERCCIKFGNCELQRVAEYVGIAEDTPRYVFRDLPVLANPLFVRDYNLCIGCTRCVRACKGLRGVGALGFVLADGAPAVGTTAPSLEDSACRFCTACVEVCPTGALLDREVPRKDREDALVPCRAACPAGIDVPRYVRLIAAGRYRDAALSIRERVPFPGVLGRVCFHPCEEACRRGRLNEPVGICALKRYAAGHEDSGWQGSLPRPRPTGKRVAVVGSGPSGLTAAYYLARMGHEVTVYESLPEPGGMLRAGILPYRLPREVLEREIRAILDAGVKLLVNVPVGQDPTLQELAESYNAVYIAVGAQASRKIELEGSELEGVLWGVDFLRQVNFNRPPAVGQRTIVVGGGNVAIDVARTALRLGARRVELYCLESREEMPAHPWEVEAALEEGVEILPGWGPSRVLGSWGKVSGLELVRCASVFDAEGRFNPRFDESSRRVAEGDTVILAIGQAPELGFATGLRLAGSALWVKDDLETSMRGVFAGGDITGPASVVEAIAAGRKAAASIDRFLGGTGDIREHLLEAETPLPHLGRVEGFAYLPRQAVPCLEPSDRTRGFDEVELGYDEPSAVAEAFRCLRCDLRLTISPVELPPSAGWLEFVPDNVAAVPAVGGVYQLFDETKSVILIAGTPDLKEALEGQLASGEPVARKARYFEYEEAPMYTMRESELISKYLQEHGRLPEGNDVLDDDLF